MTMLTSLFMIGMRLEGAFAHEVRCLVQAQSPDSPDGSAFGQVRAPILTDSLGIYAGSGSRVLTDAAGERRKLAFRQRFCGLQPCRPDPNGESGLRSRRIRGEVSLPSQQAT